MGFGVAAQALLTPKRRRFRILVAVSEGPPVLRGSRGGASLPVREPDSDLFLVNEFHFLLLTYNTETEVLQS